MLLLFSIKETQIFCATMHSDTDIRNREERFLWQYDCTSKWIFAFAILTENCRFSFTVKLVCYCSWRKQVSQWSVGGFFFGGKQLGVHMQIKIAKNRWAQKKGLLQMVGKLACLVGSNTNKNLWLLLNYGKLVGNRRICLFMPLKFPDQRHKQSLSAAHWQCPWFE